MRSNSMSGASKTVLICDDDQGMRDTIAAILQRDYRVLTVSSGEAALTILKQEDVDLMLLDVRLPGISGFDVLRIVKENYSLIECIMISAINEVETAVQAMKYGAYHYITKNFDYDELRSLVRNACERQDLNRQVITLSAQVAEQGEREFLIGPSKQIRDIVDLVHKVAKLSATVLILGESGTGKELLARLLHRESGRGEAPFIAVNLSAIPHELVESTLFGHERGLVHRRAQAAARQVRAGVAAARCSSTKSAICGSICRPSCCAPSRRGRSSGSAGRSRSGRTSVWSWRPTSISRRPSRKAGSARTCTTGINVIPIRMPPLRDRIEDLPELARLFLERYRAKFRKPVRGIADSALKILASLLVARQHPRAREPDRAPRRRQRQGMDHGRGPAARVSLREARFRARPPARRCSRRRATRSSATSSCARSRSQDWNVTATARYLGIPLSTLKHKMARLDLRDLARKLRGA